jgi:hypothetical protein
MASHPVRPSTPGSRFPKTFLGIFDPWTRSDFRRFDSQPRGHDRQSHTHCSFARTYLAPVRLTRTRLPCRGMRPTRATAQTLRRPRGHLRFQHGRCFSPTSATGPRHEHPPNRPTLAHGSSPQPTTARATDSCGLLADSAPRPTMAETKAENGTGYDEESSRRVVDITRPASVRFLSQSPSRFAPLGMPAFDRNRRRLLRGVIDRVSSREIEPLTFSVAQLPNSECTDVDRRAKSLRPHPSVKRSSASNPERLPPTSLRLGFHPSASWRSAALRPRIPIDAF